MAVEVVVSIVILAACVMTAPPVQATATASTAVVSRVDSADIKAPQRTLKEWREVVQQALKDQAGAKPLDQPAAVMKLVQLYRELLVVGQLNSGEDKRLRMLVRGRLVKLREQAPQDVRLRLAYVKSAKAKAAREKQPELLDRVKDDRAVLAQWKGVLAQFQGQGQVGVAGDGRAGGAGQDDDGQELADLIQVVISPDFWDANGGPGAIFYFQSQHALVVRATTQTHEDVANLLEALRRAGN